MRHGYIAKNDVLPVSQGVGYYTGLIRTNSKDSGRSPTLLRRSPWHTPKQAISRAR